MKQGDNDGISTQRLEAFSDGVFAIAITLLIIEIKVPNVHAKDSVVSLATALMALWPSYFAYLLSFVMIGIYWVNHHYLMRLFPRTNHTFNVLTLGILLFIAFLPFPTAVLGDYMTDEKNRSAAVTLYALGLMLPALVWFATWSYGSGPGKLLDQRLEPTFVARMTKQYGLSCVLYLIAFAASFWNDIVCLVICVGLSLLYLLEPRRPVYRAANSAAQPANGA